MMVAQIRTEYDNTATIKSKPTIIKKELEYLTKTNKLTSVVNDRSYYNEAEDGKNCSTKSRKARSKKMI